MLGYHLLPHCLVLFLSFSHSSWTPRLLLFWSDVLTCVWSQLYVTNTHCFALAPFAVSLWQIYCLSFSPLFHVLHFLKLSPSLSLFHPSSPLLFPPFKAPLCDIFAVMLTAGSTLLAQSPTHPALSSVHCVVTHPSLSLFFLLSVCLHVKWRLLADPKEISSPSQRSEDMCWPC